MNRIRNSAHVAALLIAVCFAWTPVPSNGSDEAWGTIEVGKVAIAPGEKKKFKFIGEQTFESGFIDFPILVANGRKPGVRLCITAVVHGDEINSLEIARRTFAEVDANTLSGTLVVLPAINSSGARTGDRYMPDRRDLNRYFPGNVNGSVASLVAFASFDTIKQCSHLIDLHTASNYRSNYPQIRADITDPEVLEMARYFSVGIIIAGAGPDNSLRREAMKAGIKSIIYEAGPPNVFLEPEIERGVEGIRNVMSYLGMTQQETNPPKGEVLKKSRWIRVPPGKGGIFLPMAELGDKVIDGQPIGSVTDPISDETFEIRAEGDGVIVGIALPQLVLPGYGIFHVGTLAAQ